MGASAFLKSVYFIAFAVNVKVIAPKKYLYQFEHAIWWGRSEVSCIEKSYLARLSMCIFAGRYHFHPLFFFYPLLNVFSQILILKRHDMINVERGRERKRRGGDYL